jgi:phage shock protein PspC (stress-responsive transcriptional regulator)
VQGTVLDFSVRTTTGVILDDEGNRYSFSGAEWFGLDLPLPQMRVDFEGTDRIATAIYQVGCVTARQQQDGGYFRSLDEGLVAGVCAGLAAKWTISRLGLRIVVLFIPYTWPFYVLAWLTLPVIPTARQTNQPTKLRRASDFDHKSPSWQRR